MAIQELIKNKKYHVIVSYRDSFGSPRNKKKVVYGTEKDARLVEAKLDQEIRDGFSSDIKFIELFESYLRTRTNITEESLRKEKEIHNKYLSLLNRKKVKNITPKDIQELRSKIESMEGSITQKNKAIYLLKRIFKHGSLFYQLNDPSLYLNYFKKTVAELFEYHTYTPNEFNYVLSFVRGESYKLLYEVYFWCGLRRGEALALTPRDLLDTKELRINKSVNSRLQLGTPKNESSYRNVKVHDDLYQRLKALASTNHSNLFGGLRYLPPSTVNGRFTRAISRANRQRSKDKLSIVPHIRIHDLRHSHATFLASKGIPIAAVSARLGHSSISETMSTYMHLFKGDDNRIIEMITDYLFE